LRSANTLKRTKKAHAAPPEPSHRPILDDSTASFSRGIDIMIRFLKLKPARSPGKPSKAVDIILSLASGVSACACLLVLQSKMFLRYAFSTASTFTAGLSSPSYSAAIPVPPYFRFRSAVGSTIRRLETALWRFCTECKRHYVEAISIVLFVGNDLHFAFRRYLVAVLQAVHKRYFQALLSALHPTRQGQAETPVKVVVNRLAGCFTAPPTYCGMTS